MSGTGPSVAVVIPVRGHDRLLHGCMAALNAQDVPPVEIVVIDDSPGGSLGGVPGAIVLRSGGRGPYAARNLGWRRTSAEVVLFCDARSRPRPGWTVAMAQEMENPDVVLAGSQVRVLPGASTASRAAAALQPFALENYLADPFFRPYLPTCALAVRRSALERVGGFPEVRSGGDADLCWQVLEATGGKLAAVDEVLVDWVPRDHVRDHLEQQHRYGRSNLRLRRRWEEQGALVPAPRPLARVALRCVRSGARLGVALLSRQREAAVAALGDASWAVAEAGYSLEHRHELRERTVQQDAGVGPSQRSGGRGKSVVVYVLHKYPERSETFVRNEVVVLRESGVDVRVLTVEPPDPEAPLAWGGAVVTMPHPGRAAALANLAWWGSHHPRRTAAFAMLALRARGLPGGMAWRQVPAAARELAGVRVVAVHTHFARSTLMASPLLGALLGARSSATVHARDIYVPELHAAAWLGSLDRLVTVCEYNVARIWTDGLWRGPVDVVPCGVEVPGVQPSLRPGELRVVTVGRLVPKKGMVTLVEAFALVAAHLPGATLDIIGDGPQRAEVVATVERMGLAGRVRLLGAADHVASLEAIEESSVFVLACEVGADGNSDAVPVVLREAMARARPVVTTAIAGVPEIIDSSTGWVVAPGDAAAVAGALNEALTDVEEAERRGRAARERTLASGTLALTAAGMRRVLGLDRVVGSPPY